MLIVAVSVTIPLVCLLRVTWGPIGFMEAIPLGDTDHVTGKFVFMEYVADVHKGVVGPEIDNVGIRAERTAAQAFTLPYPKVLSKPTDPKSVAVLCNNVLT